MNSEQTALTLREILRQPAAWQQAVEVVSTQAAAIRDLMQPARPDLFLFSGCGTSYYLSIAAAGFFQEITGLPARAVPASEIILSPETYLPRGQKAALFVFSRSGETTETLVAARLHRERANGPVIGVTCRPASSMDPAVDLMLHLPAADDKSVVMTSSFTTMLLAANLIAAVLGGDDPLFHRLASLPNLLGQQLEQQRAFGERAGRDRAFASFVFLGLGPFYGLASEAMLKLKEMTQVPCEAYSPLEFRHGPISIVEQGTMAVLLGSDRAAPQEMAVLADIHTLGGTSLVITGRAPESAPGLAFGVGPDLPETLRGLLYMPLVQTLAYYRALTVGRDPDQPQHLTRVVSLSEGSLFPPS